MYLKILLVLNPVYLDKEKERYKMSLAVFRSLSRAPTSAAVEQRANK